MTFANRLRSICLFETGSGLLSIIMMGDICSDNYCMLHWPVGLSYPQLWDWFCVQWIWSVVDMCQSINNTFESLKYLAVCKFKICEIFRNDLFNYLRFALYLHFNIDKLGFAACRVILCA